MPSSSLIFNWPIYSLYHIKYFLFYQLVLFNCSFDFIESNRFYYLSICQFKHVYTENNATISAYLHKTLLYHSYILSNHHLNQCINQSTDSSFSFLHPHCFNPLCRDGACCLFSSSLIVFLSHILRLLLPLARQSPSKEAPRPRQAQHLS